MNTLINHNVTFHYAGLFQSSGQWIHPQKTEQTYEIIYVTEGEVHMCEEGPKGQRQIHAKAGELFLLMPHMMHYGTTATCGVSFYWLHFSLKNGELPFKSRFFKKVDSGYLFKELLHCNNLPRIPEYLVNSVLLHILSELCLMSEEECSEFDGRAEKIYEWIRIYVDAKLTVQDISRYFGYSSDHISRICKQNFGLNAKALINKFLTAKAKSALANTDKYVKEIAADLGFPSDKAFIAYFKYHEGCFPSEFRNRYGKIHMNSR